MQAIIALERIVTVSDQSGQEERFYGKQGEVVKVIKTVVSDTGQAPKAYTTEYRYDSWARLQSLTYPDGEVLTYGYDAGGQLHQIGGEKAGASYLYLQRLEYDRFEQRAFLEMGNGVRTRYNYDPTNRRLANLQTGKSNQALFQNLNYGYDNVGNVVQLENDIAMQAASDFGGPTTQNFRL